MVAMGTRRPRRGARLYRRWALQWREDGQLLGQYLCATKCEKLGEPRKDRQTFSTRKQSLVLKVTRWVLSSLITQLSSIDSLPRLVVFLTI